MTTALLLAGLGACGVVPALALVDRRWSAVAAAPVLTALLVATAANAAVVLRVPFGAAAVAVLIAANVLAAPRVRRDRPRSAWAQGPTFFAAVLGAAISLIALRSPSIGHDGRAIWLLHARLLTGPPDRYAQAMGNSAFDFSHLDYPMLVPAWVAALWEAAGAVSLRSGQIAVALLAAAGAVGLALAVDEVAEVRRRTEAPVAVRALVALSVVLGVAWAASGGLTVAYADAATATLAATAALRALVLPLRGDHAALAAVYGMAASITKVEGTVAALAIALAYALRLSARRNDRTTATDGARPRGRWLLLAGVPAASWYLFAAISTTGLATAGRGQQPAADTAWERLTATLVAIGPQLWPIPLAVCLSLLASRSHDRPWDPPVLLWAALAIPMAFVTAGFVIGDLEIDEWLANTAFRVTTYARVIGVAELGMLALVLAPLDRARAQPDLDGQAVGSS